MNSASHNFREYISPEHNITHYSYESEITVREEVVDIALASIRILDDANKAE